MSLTLADAAKVPKPRAKTPYLAGCAALFAGAALAATAAHATTVTDPVHDILPTFNATDETKDLDVVSMTATFNATNLLLSATMAGRISTTDENFYVWGINRGAGTDLLDHANIFTDSTTDPVGQDVLFDTFITLQNDGTGNVVFLTPPDSNGVVGFDHAIDLAPGSVTISGRTIKLKIARDLLPSQGFDFADYELNLWPRYRDISANNTIADFGPDGGHGAASTFKASAAVPEPAGWALMIGGFGLVGATLRRRRLSAA